jgi:hypothetical protein
VCLSTAHATRLGTGSDRTLTPLTPAAPAGAPFPCPLFERAVPNIGIAYAAYAGCFAEFQKTRLLRRLHNVQIVMQFARHFEDASPSRAARLLPPKEGMLIRQLFSSVGVTAGISRILEQEQEHEQEQEQELVTSVFRIK